MARNYVYGWEEKSSVLIEPFLSGMRLGLRCGIEFVRFIDARIHFKNEIQWTIIVSSRSAS